MTVKWREERVYRPTGNAANSLSIQSRDRLMQRSGEILRKIQKKSHNGALVEPLAKRGEA